MGSIPRWGRSPGGGHSNPLQYSCLENPMHREAQRATVHRVTQSDMTYHKHINIYCTKQEIQLLFDNNFKWNKFIKVFNHYAINLNYYNIVNQVYLNKKKRKTKIIWNLKNTVRDKKQKILLFIKRNNAENFPEMNNYRDPRQNQENKSTPVHTG